MTKQQPTSAKIIPIREVAATRELCRNYLIIRNFYQPRLTRAENRILRATEEFLMNGGLTEDESVKYHNKLLKRILIRLTKPDGYWRAFINWFNQPAGF